MQAAGAVTATRTADKTRSTGARMAIAAVAGAGAEHDEITQLAQVDPDARERRTSLRYAGEQGMQGLFEPVRVAIDRSGWRCVAAFEDVAGAALDPLLAQFEHDVAQQRGQGEPFFEKNLVALVQFGQLADFAEEGVQIGGLAQDGLRVDPHLAVLAQHGAQVRDFLAHAHAEQRQEPAFSRGGVGFAAGPRPDQQRIARAAVGDQPCFLGGVVLILALHAQIDGGGQGQRARLRGGDHGCQRGRDLDAVAQPGLRVAGGRKRPALVVEQHHALGQFRERLLVQ